MKLSFCDTTKVAYSKLNAGFSMAFQNASNWKGVDLNSLSFATDCDFSWNKSSLKSNQYYKMALELGFTRYADSIWYKHADRFQSHYLLKTDRAKFSQTFSSTLSGGFLNSYDYTFNPVTGKTESIKSESFFNPSSFEVGLGSGYSFFQHSFVNVSLATARLRIIPGSRDPVNSEGIAFGKFTNATLYFDYGFSVHYFITKEISKLMELNASGKMFIKEFHRDKIEVDAGYKLSFKLSKLFRLKADIKIVYAPSISYKFQFRNEFLLGLFYEKPQ